MIQVPQVDHIVERNDRQRLVPVIQVRGLTKTFASSQDHQRKIRALDGVDLSVRQGEVLGVLGPNGAGKTTLLNILSTLLVPDSGEVRILGFTLGRDNSAVLRSYLNMSSGYPNFPWSLTVRENLSFYGRLYGLRGFTLRQKVEDLMELFDLTSFAGQKFDELSSGTKQKLSLAKALLNDPRVVFLDEPTIGLDPEVAQRTREVISRVLKAKGVTVLLTTHYMHEAEIMCDRIALMKKGRILRLATPEQLKKEFGKKDLEEVFIEVARRPEGQVKTGVPVPALLSEGGREVSIPLPERARQKKMIGSTWAWLNRAGAFTYRNYLFAKRNVFALTELVFWPLVSLVSIGLMGNYLELKENALGFVLTGAIAGGVLQVAQLDVAYSLLYEVWSKSMKHTFLTPVGLSEHLWGSWVIGAVRGIIIFGLLGLLALVFFGFSVPSWPAVVVFLLGIFSCALLLGILVNVLVLTFGQKAEITAWMFAYLFMLLCGIYYPVSTLPPFFFRLAQWLPITYFLEYFRQGFGFEPVFSHGLWKGFGLVVLYFVLGLRLLYAAFYQARKRGVILRLSE